LKRAWVETEVTHNVYSSGNNWGTAGAGNSSTDYDETISKAISGANIAISNDATFNSWCLSWIDGSVTNNGFYIVGGGSGAYYNFGSDDNATASNRPWLAITYTVINTLPMITDDITVNVVPGSLVASFTIPDPTTSPIAAAELALDTTFEILLEDGTYLVVGEGNEADENWTGQYAADLISGGSVFILSTAYNLEKSGAGALYFKSSLTAATSVVPFALSPLGSAALSGDVQDVLDSVLVNRASILAVTPGLNTRIENVTLAVAASLNNATSDIHARIGSATGDVRATWEMVASVSTEVGSQHSTTKSVVGGWIANATGLINEASASLGLKTDAIAADSDIVLSTLALMNNYVKVSRAFYNTDTALTNGEFLRDVPANALSHVESRWLPVADVIAENWAAYVKREFTIYSYPDSAAGTTLASHLIPSSTAPTERTWTDKGATLW
jgi:hypothetical protein